jgi:hypothetical protein
LVTVKLIPSIIVAKGVKLTITIIVPNQSTAAKVLISQSALAIQLADSLKLRTFLGSFNSVSPAVPPFLPSLASFSLTSIILGLRITCNSSAHEETSCKSQCSKSFYQFTVFHIPPSFNALSSLQCMMHLPCHLHINRKSFTVRFYVRRLIIIRMCMLTISRTNCVFGGYKVAKRNSNI